MTSLQAWLSAIAGRNFSAADMISRLKSRSIADNNYLAAVIAGSNHVAAVDSNSLQQSLYAAATCINYVAAVCEIGCAESRYIFEYMSTSTTPRSEQTEHIGRLDTAGFTAGVEDRVYTGWRLARISSMVFT